jgi:hypothetical protein
MHIGKSTRMVVTDERRFEYEDFHEPANLGTREPELWMIKINKLSVEKQSVELACKRNKIL